MSSGKWMFVIFYIIPLIIGLIGSYAVYHTQKEDYKEICGASVIPFLNVLLVIWALNNICRYLHIMSHKEKVSTTVVLSCLLISSLVFFI
jgi:hypothetical protein